MADADVLKILDANLAYGGPIPRSELTGIENLYRGVPCPISNLSNTGASDCGEIYFGTRPMTSLEDLLKGIKKRLDEHDEQFKEQDELLNEHSERFIEINDNKLEQEERTQDMWEYVKLETTPAMICSGVIGALQDGIQGEFRSVSKFVASEPKHSSSVKELKNFIGEQKDLEKWTISELCYLFVKICRKRSKEIPAGAAALLKDMVNRSMQPLMASLGPQLGPQLDEDPHWVDEWSSFRAMVIRRNQAGHPDVQHAEASNKSAGRVARTRNLYVKLVTKPGSGCGEYRNFSVRGFINLARLALEKPAKRLKLEPCNVWIGDATRRLQALLGPGFQTSNRSYLIVDDLWHADVALLHLSISWRDDVVGCLSKGVEKIVAVVESKDDSNRERLKILDRSNLRCTIQIRPSSEDDAELHAAILEALGKLTLSRPSKKKSLLMVAMDVKEEQESSRVIVEGRVERGEMKAGMELVFEAEDTIKFRVIEFQVLHPGAEPVPGAWVSVNLSASSPFSSPPSAGQLLADSRKPERSRGEFEARVVNVSGQDFVTGAYQLECTKSGLVFDVEVELKSKLVVAEETTGGGETKKKSRNKELIEVGAEALRSKEGGRVKISSQALMPLVSRAPNTSGGNYESCRFIITSGSRILTNGSVILLTGQTLE